MSRATGKERTLTPRQQRFVDLYLVDLNATQAAIQAGFSPRTAAKIASQLLDETRTPHVAAAIQAGRERLARKTHWTQERVIAQLTPIAEASMEDFLDFSGPTVTMRPAREIPVHARRAIASVKFKIRPSAGARATRVVEALRAAARNKDAAQLQTALAELAELEAATPEAPILDVVEFTLHDKQTALDQIAKHLGMYAPTKIDLQTAQRELAELLGVSPAQLPAPPAGRQTVH